MSLDDRIEVHRELEDQTASQAQNDGRVGILDASIDDQEIGHPCVLGDKAGKDRVFIRVFVDE